MTEKSIERQKRDESFNLGVQTGYGQGLQACLDRHKRVLAVHRRALEIAAKRFCDSSMPISLRVERWLEDAEESMRNPNAEEASQ